MKLIRSLHNFLKKLLIYTANRVQDPKIVQKKKKKWNEIINNQKTHLTQFTISFRGLCSNGEGTKCLSKLKICKTKTDLSMTLSSQNHVSFVSYVCLALCLICVARCDSDVIDYL